MRRMNIDTVFRVRTEYRVGQLAKLATAVADAGGLIGEIRIRSMGNEHTIRDVVVETSDEAQTRLVEASLRGLDGVEILEIRDGVFDLHRGGKLHMGSTIPLRNISDLRYAYTPGVARVSTAIQREPDLAWEYTSLGKTVGIFTNGTRVLGLGNIGPVASLPVMEGKAVLYDKFSGLSAVPILIDSEDPREFIETVVRVSRSFGGIHLEDIRFPDCLLIEEELDERLPKPVMHDDQHGTAVVALAALINVCQRLGRDMHGARVGQIGLGAAGSAIARLALSYGVQEVLVTDPNEAAVARMVGFGATATTFTDLMARADIVISTTGRPGLIPPTLVRRGQVILALSNPNPEIDPEVAMAAGAAFASDGKTINNALAFPGIFEGALAVRSAKITPEMKLAAALAIAREADANEIVPSPLVRSVHHAVSLAVQVTAKEQGLAGTARL